MQPARVEKRNRPPKSCEPCRIRKLRCNRAHPCDTCIKRGPNVVCQYAPNADRDQRQTKRHETLHDRLKHLEDLVSSAAQRTPSHHQHAFAMTPVSRVSTEKGSLGTDNTDDVATQAMQAPLERHGTFRGDSTYADSSHWSTILDSIKDIRANFCPSDSQGIPTPSEQTDYTLEEHSVSDLGLAAQPPRVVNIQRILDEIPPRQICDSLVSQYFRAHQIILPILHSGKFQREYKAFWDAPTQTSPVWFALLFAILSLSAGLTEMSRPSPAVGGVIPSAKDLSRKAQECLIQGNYANVSEHSMEALMVYVHGCYLPAKDSDVNLWLLMGTGIRLAISRGYHRDPSRLSGSTISPFEAEMRRRIWICIFQADVLMSFQLGLPSMIPSESCDAAHPQNLEDSDFDIDTEVLPASRPPTHYTPILYTIVKTSAMSVFKEVVAHTKSLTPQPYEATLALDKKVRDIYAEVPQNLKRKPLCESIFETSGIIINRLTIELLHLKSTIVLHRQYITDQRLRETRYSRETCMEAAACILDRQFEFFEATQPGGQLYDERYIISGLVTHDFILGAMIMCLDLNTRIQPPRSFGSGAHASNLELGTDFEKHYAAIQRASQVWAAAAAYSSEARIVSDALKSTISRTQMYWSTPVDPVLSQLHQTPRSQAAWQDDVPSMSMQETGDLSSGLDSIDWGFLDGTFSEDVDLDSWILDAIEP